MANFHKVTLQINHQSHLVEFRVVKEGPSEIPHTPQTSFLLSYPQVIIKVDGQKYCLLMYPEDDFGSFNEDQKLSILLFAAPHWSELHLGQWLTSGKPPAGKGRIQRLSLSDSDKIIEANEHAAGETYEQRRHLCYDDACRIILDIWRDPHRSEKRFAPIELKDFVDKSRIYELNEWENVIKWGEGDGYWSPEKMNPPPDPSDFLTFTHTGYYIINGAKMRELEAKQSTSPLGVLPEIVNRIGIEPGFSFLNDGGLRNIIERDCREINEAAKTGAAKSVIIMCGSVIEALIYDHIKDRAPEAEQAARDLAEDPANKDIKGEFEKAVKNKKKLFKWSAFVLIKVANKISSTHITDDVSTHAHVLRNYRNLIHPGKEERLSISIDHNTAAIAISVVNLVIAGLRK